MTARLDAFAPMRETRVYGKGGQFAKGGGHIPGKSSASGLTVVPPARPLFNPDGKMAPQSHEVAIGEGATEVTEPEMRQLQTELRSERSPEDEAAFEAVRDKTGAFSDQAVAEARIVYVGSGYQAINGVARVGDEALTYDGVRYTPEQLARARGRIDSLDRGFVPPPATPLAGPVYRGVQGDIFGASLSVGERFVDHGFVSASSRGDHALEFSGNLTDNGIGHRAVYRIRATAQTAMPGAINEHEWVLPRGSTFTVSGIQQFTNAEGKVRRIIDLNWDGVEQ